MRRRGLGDGCASGLIDEFLAGRLGFERAGAVPEGGGIAGLETKRLVVRGN